MQMTFRKANCVAVGAFNVYIIQPDWLAAKGFFQKSLDVTCEAKLDEPGFRYEQPGDHARWVVTPTRLAVETHDEGTDCGAIVARLLGILPETPVSMVGNNAFFDVAGGMPAPAPTPSADCLPAFNLMERISHVALRSGRTIYNLGMRYRATDTELLVSALCPISGGEGTLAASQHANEFMAHRITGLKLVEHHFGATVCSTHFKH